MKNRWTIETREDQNGDIVIDLPEDLLYQVGWKEGDTINFKPQEDGSAIMEKIKTQLVLVETVQTFRHRYVVEVPTGDYLLGDETRNKTDWALDTVTMEEAKEFSQKHLGETIVSHRVVSRDEVIELCDEDNDYCKDWSEEKKVEVFVTRWTDKTDEEVRL